MLDKLSKDELEYHQKVQQELADAKAAHNSWISHLVQKYKLNQNDTISLEGFITRSNSKTS